MHDQKEKEKEKERERERTSNETKQERSHISIDYNLDFESCSNTFYILSVYVPYQYKESWLLYVYADNVQENYALSHYQHHKTSRHSDGTVRSSKNEMHDYDTNQRKKEETKLKSIIHLAWKRGSDMRVGLDRKLLHDIKFKEEWNTLSEIDTYSA